ncbi:DUF3885 domain-containing protein [Sphingorhabdus sp. Alg231-15]|uniref:DUF3885 domain-containing protein n=1 Tax=Sphingorhabdus sp. Alg231-15 TaxID=1922222 RepID=UPI000D54D8F4
MKFRVIQDTFGVEELPHGLFYEFPWGLRFNLSNVSTSTGTRHLERFLDSLDRAKSITHAFLADSEKVTVLFSRLGPEKPVPAMNRAVNQLDDIGFDSARLNYLGAIKQGEDDYEDWRYQHWYSCHLSNELPEIDKLLWNCVAQDMGVQPYAEWGSIYLADLQKQMIVHVYDDRGMDVIAMDKETIKPFYSDLNSWLLEYDRKAMDQKFS